MSVRARGIKRTDYSGGTSENEDYDDEELGKRENVIKEYIYERI